jgi:type II secretory pathway pseudopilin PulG
MDRALHMDDGAMSRISSSSPIRDAGFTIVDVLVAMAIVACGVVGVAALFVTAIRAVHTARTETSATALAVGKMEQLRALVWSFDARLPDAIDTDTTTDLSHDPPLASGRGLLPSPPGALDENVPGYVDYLDGDGAWVGTGAAAPPAAVFVRRWSVQPLPLRPDTLLVFQVVVIPAAGAGTSSMNSAVRLVSAETRTIGGSE